MWPKTGRYIPLVVLAMAACTDIPTVAPDLSAPQATTIASTCTSNTTLINTINNNLSRVLKQPQQGDAQTLFNQLKSACSANDGALVTQRAQQILGLVDQAYNTFNIGDASLGAQLVENLLICASTPCSGALSPQLDVGLLNQAMLSSRGLIAFRTSAALPPYVLANTTAAVARGKVAFTGGNNARWGTEVVGGAWPNIPGSNMILIYGQQSADNPTGLRTSIEIRRWPDGPGNGFGTAAMVVVGACFDNAHVSPVGETVRVLRSRGGFSNLAVFVEPVFPCPPTPSSAPSMLSASVIAPVIAMARTFRLTRTVAFNPSVRIGSGTPDWSEFSSEELTTHVPVDLIEGFTSPVKISLPFTVNVTAIAPFNGGTPVAAAPVTLSIFNNSGSPGGALLQLYDADGNPVGNAATSVTVPTNAQGSALFRVGILKTGGYTLCATAGLNGYTFGQDCTDLFHVRK